jgi:hypothetical protein
MFLGNLCNRSILGDNLAAFAALFLLIKGAHDLNNFMGSTLAGSLGFRFNDQMPLAKFSSSPKVLR